MTSHSRVLIVPKWSMSGLIEFGILWTEWATSKSCRHGRPIRQVPAYTLLVLSVTGDSCGSVLWSSRIFTFRSQTDRPTAYPWKQEACKVAAILAFASLVVGLSVLFFGVAGAFLGLLLLEVLRRIYDRLWPPKDECPN